jgi:hypothetical protein
LYIPIAYRNDLKGVAFKVSGSVANMMGNGSGSATKWRLFHRSMSIPVGSTGIMQHQKAGRANLSAITRKIAANIAIFWFRGFAVRRLPRLQN